MALFLCLTSVVTAANDPPVVTNGVIIFTGNQSDGIVASPPPSLMVVSNLSGSITPPAANRGIDFRDSGAENVFLRSGVMQSNVVIETTGDNAAGIYTESVGSPGPAPDDPFLGVPVPGSPAASGGVVDVESYTTIATDGVDAHGISAGSRTTGYGPEVLDRLENFSEAGFSFSVTNVLGLPGLVGQPVVGVLIDTNGTPVAGAGGFFLLNTNGTYAFDPSTNFNDLAIGEERQTTVLYDVLGLNPSGVTEVMAASLVVTMRRDTNGVLQGAGEAYYDDYGVSYKPTDTNHLTVFPDLARYVDGLKASASAGGAGNSVSIVSAGAIETWGTNSHGVFAQSQGGQGGKGRDGSISHSADPGKPGKNGGAVSVTAHQGIITHAPESVGVLAHSVAGDGGHGGNGGTWRYGQRGGTGGDGGEVTLNGEASIHTFGDLASGVVALSEGGNGGDGGSGDFVTGGGRGGYGGLGGVVAVEGDWDIITEGDKAHGIWAKSVGGNAGTGGSGGWLAGSPGGGGQATDGGSVTLRSGGAIETFGDDSFGLYAQSVGGFGGRGGSGGGIFYAAGGNGNSAGSGGDVWATQEATGSITTHGARAHGLFVQSIGGGGGSGGGAGGLVGVGGEGAAGGRGGNVSVNNEGLIEALGTNSMGIYAQSIGGGGGDGGDAAGAVAVGGKGSGTSDGGAVVVANSGDVTATSHAIFAESIGGGGGSGGTSKGWFSVGGSGAGGGNADTVTVDNSGSLATSQDGASAIFAQSVGGGGGNGGGSVSVGAYVSVAVGGSAGAGGDGDEVRVTSDEGTITTRGEQAHGIHAQSLGGGGGKGGYAVSVAIGNEFSASVAVGGAGGGGGSSSNVFVNNSSGINTTGSNAHGIFAQSVGGGGGAGGFSVAATAGSGPSLALSVGGKGGSGGHGNFVSLTNTGEIVTTGERAYGVLAQSVGGGGGDGGFSVAGSVSLSSAAAALSFGGSGNTGGNAGRVELTSLESITTYGDLGHAVFAQSLGGGGGSGGFSVAGAVTLSGPGALGVSVGGSGGSGGNSSDVQLLSAGDISTFGDRAYGVVAQSVGGGGGDGGFSVAGAGAFGSGASVSLGFGGSGAKGGHAGTVDLVSSNLVTTAGSNSHGIFAQSLGGGGGSGGFSVAGSVSVSNAAVSLSFGGNGGGGGNASNVTASVLGEQVHTTGQRSYGVLAQSVGGGGGDGGFSVAGSISKSASVSFSMGGKGGAAGDGGTVALTNRALIITEGADAYGLFAQSEGGGGGSGGFSVAGSISTGSGGVGLSLGGDGAGGGNADHVALTSLGEDVWTDGDRAHAILAQSVGGGGGAGGFSVAGSITKSASITFSMGGKGGAAGDGGAVELLSATSLQTLGSNAHGIFAQSLGGGGGAGGFSVAGSVTLTASNPSVAVSLGGSGGGGGSASNVAVNTSGGLISTFGDLSHGVFAQSVGGGGGAGGFSVAGSISRSDNVSFSLGGGGGTGGVGGAVDVDSDSRIVTQGSNSHGIFAQSLGGGGGAGGFSVAGTLSTGNTNSMQVAVSIGGAGGPGSHSTNVSVRSSGEIMTLGDDAHGIFAQSVGGGGGAGGFSAAGVLGRGGNHTNVNIAFSLGGGGGGGGYAGHVDVLSTNSIVTRGAASHGILAQSIGGGGGVGGASYAAIVALDGTTNSKTVNLNAAIGGKGGTGNNSGEVIVRNEGWIETGGDAAHGIFAQSVGGGGGVGGDARTISLVLGKPALPLLGTSGMNKSGSLAVGGSGGGASDGDLVHVLNTGDILTRGADSYGILAQSVGGGGGAGGGGAHGFSGLDSPIPPELGLVFVDKIKPWKNLSIIVGGNAGSAGNGGGVSVTNEGNITTLGEASYGILAQSVGGGGGIGIATNQGGSAGAGFLGKVAIGGAGGAAGHGSNVWVLHTGDIDTSGAGAHAILAQSIGGGGGIAGDVARTKIPFTDEQVGIGLAWGRDGGSAGDGGEVEIDTKGTLLTRGVNAHGILAQSIGGGGGLAGDIGTGLGFAGSVGGNGSGGAVKVNHSGDITTIREGSHGIFAQSAGSNVSGMVEVTLTGSITALGADSSGIFAQSVARSGVQSDISILIEDGTVMGGFGSAAGIWLAGGANNTITNRGTITSRAGVAGKALIGTDGNDFIENLGVVTGSVDLGAGGNVFNNTADGILNAGTELTFGFGSVLTNAGWVSPGGMEVLAHRVSGRSRPGWNRNPALRSRRHE